MTPEEVERFIQSHLRPTRKVVAMVCDEYLDELWQLTVLGNGSVRMVYIGWGFKQPPLEMMFKNLNEIPDWAKDRLVVLRMLEVDRDGTTVYGVGRRVSENRFWVVKKGERGVEDS